MQLTMEDLKLGISTSKRIAKLINNDVGALEVPPGVRKNLLPVVASLVFASLCHAQASALMKNLNEHKEMYMALLEDAFKYCERGRY